MKKVTRYLRNTFSIALFILAISASGALAATFTITNTNDSGAGSLRDALMQANTNAQEDTINFDPAVFNVPRTITLTSGEIPITAEDMSGNNQIGRLVTINGPGANLLTISGNNASRIFLLTANPGHRIQNANVVMSGMTLTQGNGVSSALATGSGGAIYALNAAHLTLNSMVFRDNTGASNGGAMYLNGTRTLVINDSLITENLANTNGGMYINAESGSFVMKNTTISNNTATDSHTGGIFVRRGDVEIKNCQITGNAADRNVGGMNFYQSAIDMSDTIISNNSAGGSGGGLLIETSSSILRRVTISNNSGLNSGGGMVLENHDKFTMIDSLVSNNSITNSQFSGSAAGGGISISVFGGTNASTKIINTTISGNTARYAGGAIANGGRNTQFINSTIVNNTVTDAGTSSNRGGGGIVDYCVLASCVGGPSDKYRVILQNTIIANNNSPNNGPDLRNLFLSNGYNIIGNTQGSGTSAANTGDLFNVNPQLDVLADNGGATKTHAPLAGSPAINAGSNALAVDQDGNKLRYDQRGACFDRIVGGTVDIGAFELGASGTCKRARFDFDGDGKTDVSVFRPDQSQYFYLRSSDGVDRGFQFGSPSDTPVPADFTGDGKTDIAFFRPSSGQWFVLRSEDESFFAFPFGANGDIPAPGDFDGDGKDDAAVFRPSIGTWFILNSSDGSVTTRQFGLNGDVPIVEDYDGDGKADLAVYRPSVSEWYLQRSRDGFIGFRFGAPNDTKPTPADFTGDGKADIAFFAPSTGRWFVLRSEDTSFFAFPFGATGDIPAPGDYDGDGKADAAVFRGTTKLWYVNQTSSGQLIVQFGSSGDKPLPAAFLP